MRKISKSPAVADDDLAKAIRFVTLACFKGKATLKEIQKRLIYASTRHHGEYITGTCQTLRVSRATYHRKINEPRPQKRAPEVEEALSKRFRTIARSLITYQTLEDEILRKMPEVFAEQNEHFSVVSAALKLGIGRSTLYKKYNDLDMKFS